MKTREYHGLRQASEYKVWSAMVQRCTNPRNPNYRHYGARGIVIAPEWRASFLAFYRHIGPRPSLKHSVDRINNADSYVPGNVRWATDEQQAQNQDKTWFIAAFGETHCLSEWARIKGLSVAGLFNRLHRPGWTVERALSAPNPGRFAGRQLTLAQVCEMRALSASGMDGKQIGARFGVVTSTACRVVSGKTWKDAALTAAIKAERAKAVRT